MWTFKKFDLLFKSFKSYNVIINLVHAICCLIGSIKFFFCVNDIQIGEMLRSNLIILINLGARLWALMGEEKRRRKKQLLCPTAAQHPNNSVTTSTQKLTHSVGMCDTSLFDKYLSFLLHSQPKVAATSEWTSSHSATSEWTSSQRGHQSRPGT